MKKLTNIIIRYLIILAVSIPNFWIFYAVLTPLTIYTSYFLLNIFFDCSLSGNLISVSAGCYPIEIVRACVAGSAYALLFILNLATPNIKPKKRIKLLIIAFASLFILNILRIFILSLMFIAGSELFNITHQIFWYVISIGFVAGIWFTQVKLFKIKNIPVYSDLKLLYKKAESK